MAETSGAGTCTATHSYAANGTYTITVKVTDNGGAAKSVTSTMYVTTSGTAPAGLSPLSLTAPSLSVLTRPATPAKTAVPHQHAVKKLRPVAHRPRVSRIRF